MNVNELRVGNYVHHNSSMWSYRNEDGNTSHWDGNFQWEISDFYAIAECTLFEDAIEPIELNEELLLRAGFKENAFTTLYEIGDIAGEVCDDGFYVIVCNVEYRIKYLHQLQNFYLALTGNELIINTK